MKRSAPSKATEQPTPEPRHEQELAAAAERARLRVDVAKQSVRLAKEDVKRARKRYKEAKREAKRARKRAATARKAWKQLRKQGRRGRPGENLSVSSRHKTKVAASNRKAGPTSSKSEMASKARAKQSVASARSRRFRRRRAAGRGAPSIGVRVRKVAHGARPPTDKRIGRRVARMAKAGAAPSRDQAAPPKVRRIELATPRSATPAQPSVDTASRAPDSSPGAAPGMVVDTNTNPPTRTNTAPER